MSAHPSLIGAVLRSAFDRRLELIERFREAPNIHCGDNWRSEEEAIGRAKAALEAGTFAELDVDDLVQVRVGLEFNLMDKLDADGPSDAELETHRMLVRLMGDENDE